jgi:hypothetical protein
MNIITGCSDQVKQDGWTRDGWRTVTFLLSLDRNTYVSVTPYDKEYTIYIRYSNILHYYLVVTWFTEALNCLFIASIQFQS